VARERAVEAGLECVGRDEVVLTVVLGQRVVVRAVGETTGAARARDLDPTPERVVAVRRDRAVRLGDLAQLALRVPLVAGRLGGAAVVAARQPTSLAVVGVEVEVGREQATRGVVAAEVRRVVAVQVVAVAFGVAAAVCDRQVAAAVVAEVRASVGRRDGVDQPPVTGPLSLRVCNCSLAR
jgi:hypothetical protein